MHNSSGSAVAITVSSLKVLYDTVSKRYSKMDSIIVAVWIGAQIGNIGGLKLGTR